MRTCFDLECPKDNENVTKIPRLTRLSVLESPSADDAFFLKFLTLNRTGVMIHHDKRSENNREPGSLIRIALCIVILGAGAAGAWHLKKSSPKAGRRPPAKMTPLVRIVTVHREIRNVTVRAMGTVIPNRETVLKTRVSGEVRWMHPEFTEGGLLKKGTRILRIDPRDYELAVARKKRAVAEAEYALKIERGRQDVARREWKLLNGKTESADNDLALRKPHLEKVRAELAAARAELEQAELDLSRTQIYAPFNALVRDKHVDVGSQVSVQDRLADLAGTDSWRIRVSVPVDRLKWIQIPKKHSDEGSGVRIFYRENYEREGKVSRMMGDLEERGLMARVLVTADDPLDLKIPDIPRPPLLIGEYVNVEIQSSRVANAFRIPRTALRDNTAVWVAGADGKLDIRPVKTVWRDESTVLVDNGLRDGDRIIVSDLSAPVPGMELKVEDDSPTDGKES